MKKIECTDIFNPNNTEWEYSWDDEGHNWYELVYTGDEEDIKEICEEYKITEDEFYELLSEYEDLSRFEMED